MRFEISVRSMLAALLVGTGAWLLVKLVPVVLVLIVALFLVGTLSPAVERLEARGVHRGVAIVLVFAGSFLIAGVLAALTFPTLSAQVTRLFEDEPALRAGLIERLAKTKLTTPLADSLRGLRTGFIAKEATRVALAYSTRVIEIVTYAMSSVFLALYLMIDRDRARGALFALVPRTHHIRLSRVLLNLQVIVGGYIRGQLITSALMVVFVVILLTICRVPNAIAIGVFAGVADVLPYVGVILSVVPAVIAALPRGTGITLTVLFVLLAYQELESRVLVPRIYGHALRLPSSAIMLALLAGGTLLGIAGAFLALPVAAAIRMLLEELRVELPGEALDDAPLRERDQRGEEEYAGRTEGVPVQEAAAIAVQISEERLKDEIDDPPSG